MPSCLPPLPTTFLFHAHGLHCLAFPMPSPSPPPPALHLLAHVGNILLGRQGGLGGTASCAIVHATQLGRTGSPHNLPSQPPYLPLCLSGCPSYTFHLPATCPSPRHPLPACPPCTQPLLHQQPATRTGRAGGQDMNKQRRAPLRQQANLTFFAAWNTLIGYRANAP